MNKQSIKKRFEKEFPVDNSRNAPAIQMANWTMDDVWNFISKEIDKAVEGERKRFWKNIISKMSKQNGQTVLLQVSKKFLNSLKNYERTS